MHSAHIANHNKRADKDAGEGLDAYWLGINEFSDLTHAEFLAVRRNPNRRQQPRRAGLTPWANATARGDMPPPPSAVDWRAKGAVNPVKNQGQCGSVPAPRLGRPVARPG